MRRPSSKRPDLAHFPEGKRARTAGQGVPERVRTQGNISGVSQGCENPKERELKEEGDEIGGKENLSVVVKRTLEKKGKNWETKGESCGGPQRGDVRVKREVKGRQKTEGRAKKKHQNKKAISIGKPARKGKKKDENSESTPAAAPVSSRGFTDRKRDSQKKEGKESRPKPKEHGH